MGTNTIAFFGIKATRALEREVERRMEKWIRREQGWFSGAKPWAYSIEIDRDGSPQFYYCSLQIFGEEEWTSYGTGRTLHDAITDALKNVKNSCVISALSDRAMAYAVQH